MGSKKSKESGGKDVKIPPKLSLSKKDYDFLTHQTGLSKDEIKAIHDEFMANNPDGLLDRREFIRLYDRLRSEPPEVLDEISEFAFRAFDADNNGRITFSEFLVAYAMTSRGDQRHKLEYAFEVYDADNNGSLDSGELRTVIYGMLDMLVSLCVFCLSNFLFSMGIEI
jgi:Ca2+-binding EF-hand superfamily protein